MLYLCIHLEDVATKDLTLFLNKTPNLCLAALILMSMILGGMEVLLNLQDKEVSDSSSNTWSFVFLVGTIFWTYYDADRKDFEKPFDFGFLIYVFWPVAFPWYLVQTRGIEGLMIYFGFIFLWLAPWIMGLITYMYFT